MNEPVTVRVTSPKSMVAALPVIMGYTPHQSVVVAALHEPRGQMGLLVRYDLDPGHLDEILDECLTRLTVQGADRMALLVYDDEHFCSHRPYQDGVRQFVWACSRTGIQPMEVGHVSNGRYRSYVCDDEACCPSEGVLVEEDEVTSLIRSETVLRGGVQYASREELEQSLAAPAMDDSWLQEVPAGARDAADWQRACEQGPRALGTDELRALALSLFDVKVRDMVLATCDHELLSPVLRAVLAVTPWPYRAPVATVLAWALACTTSGAEVTILLEQVQEHEPNYTLAGLLDALVRAQFSRSALRAATASISG